MSVEIRRVPANWEHPKSNNGHYIPHHEHFQYNKEEIEEGLHDGWLKNEPPNYGCNVMPQWLDSERTHYQMYEDVTEGTPISPVMATPEELAKWLVENNATMVAYEKGSYEDWMAVIRREFHPAIFFTHPTGVMGITKRTDK